MKGKDLLLILAHLFRKKGNQVQIEDAVEFLSFRCRISRPSVVRKIFSLATEYEMISIEDDSIKAEFLYDRQILSPNLVEKLKGSL
jgi:hypothetical protein